jgi:hypothetical protein
MSKHPIDHDHICDDGKVVGKYSRIEREQADDMTDPKVRAMIKAERDAVAESDIARLKSYMRIDRKRHDT